MRQVGIVICSIRSSACRTQPRHLEQQGRNIASERFNYDYPEDSLAGIVPGGRLAPETFTTHVIMNNNMETRQRNAATLARIPEEQRKARVRSSW